MSIVCYVDGASRGQGTSTETVAKVYCQKCGEELGCTDEVVHPPGDGAIGVAIYRNNKLIGQFARGLGKRTNNEAEYEAVIHALMMCWAADLPDPLIYSDSQVVVKQINGEWDCRNESLIPLLATVKEIQSVFRFRIKHVKRSIVYEADTLCNLFLDKMYEDPNG